ncbi:MAG: 3-dehydroquinate synthase, partial [Bacteroidales bacterium]|nr:3-dehydroquinate synthase [Bacteroidales bacterium]
NELIKRNAGRDTFILGFGGGVVLDITGFAASLFKRGCRFGFVATSLLSMADASVGGKNGINFGNLKNLIGTINQPEWVVCDVKLLNTLPDEDFKSGLGEIMKYSMIADKNLLQFMNINNQKILNKDFDVLNHLIKSSVNIKAGFVVEDEFDHGQRQHLNFGHSFGHAIETRINIKHGIAVAKGMLIATKISVAMQICNKSLIDKISALISSFDISLDYEIDDVVWQNIANDKKNRGNKIRMILIRDIGDTIIHDFDIEELKNIVQKI